MRFHASPDDNNFEKPTFRLTCRLFHYNLTIIVARNIFAVEKDRVVKSTIQFTGVNKQNLSSFDNAFTSIKLLTSGSDPPHLLKKMKKK